MNPVNDRIRKMLSPPLRMINRISMLVHETSDPVLISIHAEMLRAREQSAGDSAVFWELLNKWLAAAELKPSEWTWDGFIQLLQAVSGHSKIIETLREMNPADQDVAVFMDLVLKKIRENETDRNKRQVLELLAKRYFDVRPDRSGRDRGFGMFGPIDPVAITKSGIRIFSSRDLAEGLGPRALRETFEMLLQELGRAFDMEIATVEELYSSDLSGALREGRVLIAADRTRIIGFIKYRMDKGRAVCEVLTGDQRPEQTRMKGVGTALPRPID